MVRGGKTKSEQVSCQRSDVPSERAGFSSRNPPEPDSAAPSLRPTEGCLQTQQDTESVVRIRSSAWPLVSVHSQRSGGEPTCFTSCDVPEVAREAVWSIWGFNHVTCFWIQQDGQQVAFPCSLHHFPHLGGEMKTNFTRFVRKEKLSKVLVLLHVTHLHVCSVHNTKSNGFIWGEKYVSVKLTL